MTEADLPDGRIPFVVGVTGHRDLLPQDYEELAARVRSLLQSFLAQFPNSPAVLLSSLAEGADQLAAEQALMVGYRLIAVLPLPMASFEEDFGTEAGKAKFRELVSKAAAVIEIPAPAGPHERSVLERPYAYARAAAYLVQHSSLFIALWDGNESPRAGGTAQTVRYRLRGVPPELDDDWDPMQYKEMGIVHIIRSRRKTHSTPIADPFQESVVTSTGKPFQRSDLSALERLDGYNKEWLELRSADHKEWSLLPAGVSGADKLRSELPQLDPLEKRFQAADSMAIAAQQEANSTLLLILLLGFTSAVGVNQLQKLPSGWLFSLCATAIGFAYFLYYRRIYRGKAQEKHQDYRGIAEALRVQFYWALLGIFDRAALSFLRSTGQEGAWIRTAVRFATAELPVGRADTRDECFRAAEHYWIEDQRKYYEKSFRQQLSKNMALSSLKFSLLLFAGLFKLLPDTIRWLLADPTTRTIWFLAGQGVIAVFLVGFHIWLRAKELAAQRDVFELIDDVQGNKEIHKVGFWSRPIGLLVLVAIAIGSAVAFGYSVVAYRSVDFRQAARICELAFLTAASAAAMLHLFGYLAAYADHLRQYGRMFSLFGHAELLYREALASGRKEDARKIARTLGQEALHEASDWLRLHRSRPIEVPRP